MIFTEHRDTLTYLVDKIRVLLGQDAVVEIHGSLLREERRKAQARFLQDPDVTILAATDAAANSRAMAFPTNSEVASRRARTEILTPIDIDEALRPFLLPDDEDQEQTETPG